MAVGTRLFSVLAGPGIQFNGDESGGRHPIVTLLGTTSWNDVLAYPGEPDRRGGREHAVARACSGLLGTGEGPSAGTASGIVRTGPGPSHQDEREAAGYGRAPASLQIPHSLFRSGSCKPSTTGW